MTNKYKQYSVQDFDTYDCLKISKRMYLVLLFVLRGYIVWLLSVTNMRDRVSIIQWIYPETALFYLSLVSGAVGLYVVLVISLRRPEAKPWVKVSWQHVRKIIILALIFDLFASLVGFFYWQLLSVSWILIQSVISVGFIYLCYSSERLTLNLQEFPEKVIENKKKNKKITNNS